MLPNWLYGKSKSKLASILGGGGGAPADYNQVKAQVTQNAEDIELLSDTKAALTQISNPNLLDNPWFTVNQRGENSYPYANYTYWMDRWKLLESETIGRTIALDDGISISAGTGMEPKDIVCQVLEKERFQFEKVYTLSIMLNDGKVHSISGILPTPDGTYKIPIETHVPGKISIRVTEELNKTIGIIMTLDRDNAPFTIKAVKLEFGSVSTLAMDTAPNYATELLKCQKYFYKTLQFDDNGTNISPNQCLAVSTTRLQGIKFPAEMRANPTITVNKVNELGSSTAITGVISQWTSKEGISYFTIADATVGNLYIVDFEASAEF